MCFNSETGLLILDFGNWKNEEYQIVFTVLAKVDWPAGKTVPLLWSLKFTLLLA